jgi:hypothetical protein
MVMKMNTLGFYARTYIDALTAAFTPVTPVARASQTAHQRNFEILNERAQAKAAPLPRAA